MQRCIGKSLADFCLRKLDVLQIFRSIVSYLLHHFLIWKFNFVRSSKTLFYTISSHQYFEIKKVYIHSSKHNTKSFISEQEKLTEIFFFVLWSFFIYIWISLSHRLKNLHELFFGFFYRALNAKNMWKNILKLKSAYLDEQKSNFLCYYC